MTEEQKKQALVTWLGQSFGVLPTIAEAAKALKMSVRRIHSIARENESILIGDGATVGVKTIRYYPSK